MSSNNLNLNEFLMPENSPIAQNQGQVSAYQFDYENEAVAKIRTAAVGNAQIGTAAIGTANIGTLSFNEISGGTATFGGTSNGNGLVEVLNASGGTVVTVNNQGISVTGGSITVVNSSGGTVVDPIGLVSTTNFINYATDVTDAIVSGTAWTILTDGTINLALTRNAIVIYAFNAMGSVSTSSIAELNMFNFTAGSITYSPPLIYNAQLNMTFSMTGIITSLSSGTSSFVLRARVASGGGTATFPNASLSAVVLGK